MALEGLAGPGDVDRLTAAIDLVGRAGARSFCVGYLHDDPANPGWYAHAQYKGARVTVEDFGNPVDAAEALAVRLLTGARCACGKLVALTDLGAVAYPGATLADGSVFTEEQARAGQCRWRRQREKWLPSHALPRAAGLHRPGLPGPRGARLLAVPGAPEPLGRRRARPGDARPVGGDPGAGLRPRRVPVPPVPRPGRGLRPHPP
jgi:hypothetical protein